MTNTCGEVTPEHIERLLVVTDNGLIGRLFVQLLVKARSFQFLDKAVVVETLRLGLFGLRVARRRLVENFDDAFARVVGNLVNVVERVLIDGIDYFWIGCASEPANRSATQIRIAEEFRYALRVTFHKAPDEILVAVDEGTACHPGIMREIDAGLDHVHQETRAGFLGP